uniref:NADH dehydrogenase subunit 6 n=1 Tax=Regioscalpellum regium TaxID=2977353 RepID=UPI0021CCEE80|nr:NADH dehydrogenase subunit 6 [Regioscalpellum regium]UWM13006.1 NADH dehydrogenase subunit 6 [Regioscalpellum regium]
MNIMISLMFTTNFMFLFMFHPLAMIFLLIIQTIFISVTLFYLLQFPWFSYTLVLVFLGGMLVIFSYMANIASNEMIKTNLHIFIPLSLTIFMSTFMSMTKVKTLESFNFETMSNMKECIVMKPFSNLILPITTLMACYIILTLLVVVKMSKMNQGNLRIN